MLDMHEVKALIYQKRRDQHISYMICIQISNTNNNAVISVTCVRGVRSFSVDLLSVYIHIGTYTYR